ncbi:GDSL-type esterase/lipase family protein [Tepidiforma sp.]|uniref:GDSL-type esterase/lipase family protein n=1 Tax=Tepidiforma sp. TaxID=2682230 RepID=UPI002ADE4204|nr:GDSL-type esterase/lipase family protein [Tepidiforma sp.]
MKILRIGVSDDEYGPLPDEQRFWYIVQQRLAEELGEPVETIRKRGWPGESLAGALDRWVERERPDLVVFCAASYWVSFPSAPTALERARLPLARPLAKVATAISRRPAIARTAPFRAARRLAYRTIGHRYFFEPLEAAAHVEAALRRVLRYEDVAVGVRGPIPLGLPLPPRLAAESRARCDAFGSILADLCDALHIPYLPAGPDEPPARSELQPDLTHVNAAGHARRAEHEYRLHRAALQQSGRLAAAPER